MAMNNVIIIKGEDATIDFLLSKEDGRPFPLDGFEGATAFFPKDDETTAIAVSGNNTSCGVIQVFLDREDDTPNLLEGEAQSVQLDFLVSGLKKSVIFDSVLTVKANLF